MTTVPTPKRVIKMLLSENRTYKRDVWALARVMVGLWQARQVCPNYTKPLARAASKLVARYAPLVRAGQD